MCGPCRCVLFREVSFVRGTIDKHANAISLTKRDKDRKKNYFFNGQFVQYLLAPGHRLLLLVGLKLNQLRDGDFFWVQEGVGGAILLQTGLTGFLLLVLGGGGIRIIIYPIWNVHHLNRNNKFSTLNLQKQQVIH